MKCSCGSILPENAKFCGKCGKSVIRTENLNCLRCGNILLSGAKFCGKCGEPVYKAGNAKCTRCGNALVSGTKFCGKCGLAVSSSEPAPTPVSPTAEPEKQWVEPLQRWLNSQISNKRKVKQVLIIVLVIGLCLTFTGLAGKIMMGGLTNSIKNTNFVSDLGLGSELENILNRSAGNLITKLAVSVIKNDPSDFVNGINKLSSSISSMAGDPYGLNGIGQMLISSIAQEAFYEVRSALIEEAGLLWPLLQIMAYYSEMVTIGLIASIIAAALLFLLDGKLYDIWRLNMQNIVYIGCVWSVLVIVASIIVCFAI